MKEWPIVTPTLQPYPFLLPHLRETKALGEHVFKYIQVQKAGPPFRKVPGGALPEMPDVGC